MTGQSLLDVMEILHPELQLQPGETDVTKGLLALNVAQDHLEALLATMPGCMGGQVGTVVTTNGVETVAFPASLLRLDRIQYLDSNGRPQWDLTPLYNVGGHASSGFWPYTLTEASGGKPQGYWTDGTNIYLAPRPDGAHTLRYYGFISAADITAGGTFAYKDIARVPMATFAVRMITTGNNDPQEDYTAFAAEVFKPVLKAYENFRAESGKGFQFRYVHDT